MLRVNLKNDVRNSKSSFNTYDVGVIEIVSDYVEDGQELGIVIEDFKTKVPFVVKDLPVHIVKDDSGRYVIKELNYSVPYQYNLGLSLVLMKQQQVEENK